MKVDDKILQEAKELIQQSKRIVITNHVNPDGDAMGSALGLSGVLKKVCPQLSVVVPNSYPSFLHWMQGNDDVVQYEQDPRGKELIEKADLIIHLDYNSLKRSGPMQEVLEGSRARKIVLDHHQQPDDFPDVLISDAAMSSTSEMVFHFLAAVGWKNLLDEATASCLYTGIMTDTGNFRFSSTTPATHRVAADLIALGVKPNIIASKIYDSNTPGRLKLLSCVLRRMEVLPGYATAILTLTEEDLNKHDFQKGDTEGFVNYGLSVKDVEFSIFAYPREGRVKMSFRSKSDFDVNAFARKHFSGGGHLNAAGGVSDESLEDTVQKIKAVLPEYKNALPSI